jgi:hypothetical protein
VLSGHTSDTEGAGLQALKLEVWSQGYETRKGRKSERGSGVVEATWDMSLIVFMLAPSSEAEV